MVKMTKADDYRKRADVLGKTLKKGRGKQHRAPLVRKQKALNDMAENEDWLAGKPGTGIAPGKK
jgi:hypothetical protein